jgi:hypothetical protein
MTRQYYVERDRETTETGSRREAARIAAEWVKGGYDVTTVVVEATDEAVEAVASIDAYATAQRPSTAPGHA